MARPADSGPVDASRARIYPAALRGPGWRWWRPLVGLAIMTGLLIATLILVAIMQLVQAAAHGIGLSDLSGDEAEKLSATWDGLLLVNLGLACGIPLALAVTAWGHGRSAGFVSSVAGRVRWRWLGLCVAVSVLLCAAPIVALQVLAGGEPLDPEPQWALVAVVVLLTTPLQSAGEEYFFRGWLGQAVGGWARAPWVSAVLAGLVSSSLFALAHGSQNVWLFADRFLFGVIAWALVCRTGGLEASTALHAVNNLTAFGIAIAYGQLQDSLTTTSAPAADVLVSEVFTLGPAIAIWLLARRRRLVWRIPGGMVRPAARGGEEAVVVSTPAVVPMPPGWGAFSPPPPGLPPPVGAAAPASYPGTAAVAPMYASPAYPMPAPQAYPPPAPAPPAPAGPLAGVSEARPASDEGGAGAWTRPE